MKKKFKRGDKVILKQDDPPVYKVLGYDDAEVEMVLVEMSEVDGCFFEDELQFAPIKRKS